MWSVTSAKHDPGISFCCPSTAGLELGVCVACVCAAWACARAALGLCRGIKEGIGVVLLVSLLVVIVTLAHPAALPELGVGRPRAVHLEVEAALLRPEELVQARVGRLGVHQLALVVPCCCFGGGEGLVSRTKQ